VTVRSLRRAATAFIAALLLVSCGVSNDDSPRDIPEADQQPLGFNPERSAGAASGTARIYLLGSAAAGQTAAMIPVARDVNETPTAVLEALLEGANATELTRQYRSAVPAGTELRAASLRSGVLWVDLSAELLQLSGNDLIDAVAQIVFTASEIEGVQGVWILVDGQEQQWPDGSGELQRDPLTVFDFPGLVASAQPAYPAIPSPTQP
jgi:spore germination protein GerM